MLKIVRLFMILLASALRISVWTAIEIKQYPMILYLGRRKLKSLQKCNDAVGNKYAIVAMQDMIQDGDGLIDLLRELKQQGVNSIIVVNGKLSAATKDLLTPLAYLIMVRNNFGRDMAAYKCATLFLYDNNVDVERLLYFNDSMIYLPGKQIKSLIENLLDPSYDVIGLTENQETNYHVGSFIQSISKSVFMNNRTRKFWNSYRPYNLRIHSINKGELLLSNAFKKQNARIKVLFTTAMIAEKLQNESLGNLLDEYAIFLRKEFQESELQKNIASAISSSFLNKKKSRNIISDEYLKKIVINAICADITGGSQIHRGFGLFFHCLEIPAFKKDIIFRMIYRENQVALVLKSLDPKLRFRICDILTQKGYLTKPNESFSVKNRIQQLFNFV